MLNGVGDVGRRGRSCVLDLGVRTSALDCALISNKHQSSNTAGLSGMKVAMKKQLNKDVEKLKTPEKKLLQSTQGVATESSDSVYQASAGWGQDASCWGPLPIQV